MSGSLLAFSGPVQLDAEKTEVRADALADHRRVLANAAGENER